MNDDSKVLPDVALPTGTCDKCEAEDVPVETFSISSDDPRSAARVKSTRCALCWMQSGSPSERHIMTVVAAMLNHVRKDIIAGKLT